MLRIYQTSLELCATASGVARVIEKRDADLARQLRRAATSVPLNIAEGSYSQGGNRRCRYFSAMASAREALACFETARAMGYVGDVDAGTASRFALVIGVLHKLTRGG